MGYSVDLRERVIRFIEGGGTKCEASRLFCLSRDTIYRWLRKKAVRGRLQDDPPKRGWKKIEPAALLALVTERPDGTLAEYAQHFGATTVAVCLALKRLKITRKKKTTLYQERDEKKRAVFLEHIALYPKENLVFVDESGIDSFIAPSFGWAPRGAKVRGEVSGKRFARESFIAAKRGSKILAPFCFQGTCNTALFEMWVETFLLPTLLPGHVVIMDNATFHKSEKTRKLIESSGCHLIFLPPYSPDLNPIEKFWAWFKAKIKTLIKTFETLQKAIDHVFLLSDS